jgi:hypothetical protein
MQRDRNARFLDCNKSGRKRCYPMALGGASSLLTREGRGGNQALQLYVHQTDGGDVPVALKVAVMAVMAWITMGVRRMRVCLLRWKGCFAGFAPSKTWPGDSHRNAQLEEGRVRGRLHGCQGLGFGCRGSMDAMVLNANLRANLSSVSEPRSPCGLSTVGHPGRSIIGCTCRRWCRGGRLVSAVWQGKQCSRSAPLAHAVPAQVLK